MKIAVLLYLYHLDLWPEFRKLLEPLKSNIILYLGLCKENNYLKKIIKEVELFDSIITFHKNYGADVAPFLCQLMMVNEPYFIKIHSKKSFLGNKNHINWRNILLNSLIGSEFIFNENITKLDKNNIGAICNKNLLIKGENKNSRKIQEICCFLNIDYNLVKNSYFCGGNMFLSKTNLYKEIFSSNFEKINVLLQQEKRKVIENKKGTYSHSLERIFGYIVKHNKLNFAFAKQNVIKIINKNSSNKKYFNLVKSYNNYVYIVENINLCGTIVENNNKIITIKWHHLKNDNYQTYRFIYENYVKNEKYI